MMARFSSQSRLFPSYLNCFSFNCFSPQSNSLSVESCKEHQPDNPFSLSTRHDSVVHSAALRLAPHRSTPVMTCLISPTNHTFPGHSYVSSYRQDFKHLSSRTEYNSTPRKGPSTPRAYFSPETRRPTLSSDGRRTNISSLKAISEKYFSRLSPSRPSMVKAGNPPQHRKSSSRSAGQATSPQSIATNTTLTPASLRVSASVDNRQYHGQLHQTRSSVPSVRRTLLTPESDTDSNASHTSTSDLDSDFSSRATTPDDDDDVGTRESIIARKKREFVDMSMELFTQECYKWFTSVFGIVECAGGEKRKRPAERSGDDVNRSNANSGPPAGGQKRRQFDEDDGCDGAHGNGDDEDDDGGEGRAAGKKRTKRVVDKFACPYMKHDPAKYENQRTCCGPGWDDVHRVKEHLFRRHTAPKFVCHRCNETFGKDDQYKTHQRAATRCPLRESNPPDGFDETKEKQLRTRQKSSNQLSERQKWEEMYAILFPDDLIPSPYFDKTDAKNDNRHVTEDVTRYEQYLHRQLLPMVRHELKREVDAEFDDVGERLKTKTLDMVQNVALRIFREWAQGSHHQPQPSSIQPRSPTPDSRFVRPEADAVSSAEQVPTPDIDLAILDGMAVMEGHDFSFDMRGSDFLGQFLEISEEDVTGPWDFPLQNYA